MANGRGQWVPRSGIRKRSGEQASPESSEGAPQSTDAPKKVAKPRRKKTAASNPASTEPVNGFQVIEDWLLSKDQTAFPFQEETWHAFSAGQSGIVNAPTGFGKTFAVFLAVVIDWMNRHPDYKSRVDNGIQLLWISPLRALAADIARAMQAALDELEIPWSVSVRNGDTSTAERQKQKREMPEVLVITPESLQLIFASKGYPQLFKGLTCVCVDEWHELLGSKRGVQVELALAHLRTICGASLLHENLENASEASVLTATPAFRIWALSATIGNLDEALSVLLGTQNDGVLIRANLRKDIRIHTVLPDAVERLPWAGHLGIRLIDKVLPIIRASRSTLLFTNTRSHAERWYQTLLDAAPDLAGALALHHSAIEPGLRFWVEEQLHMGTLQCVVCTASLDLGVDFRPVDTIIQIGSPKGVARFLQRAGRSGHQPGEVSSVYFVPTHSLEIAESSALQRAYEQNIIESRKPVILAYDVLVQYLVTRAAGEGFIPEAAYAEVISTHCYADLSRDEWAWMLSFITQGGATLSGYDEYHRVDILDGVYRVTNRRIAMRHRMHIGTIVGDALMRVKFLGGGHIGTIEESFISRLKPGDTFVLAGRTLELIMVRDMEALVRRSNAKNAVIPSWQGSRMALSADFGTVLRQVIQEAVEPTPADPLLRFLRPLFELQRRRSHIPAQNEFLVELIRTRDGYHLFAYPFEGRTVHAALAGLLAHRLSRTAPITFSIAANDYGFELLSDQPIPFTEDIATAVFSPDNLYPDLQRSVNATELSRRKFRDIAVISGLVFQGMPGAYKKQRHLQSSSSLVYDVLVDAEPNSLLLQQASTEALTQELEIERLHQTLVRIQSCRLILTQPGKLTPFCFPIKVDSLREQLSSEKLEDRIRRMQQLAD